jgi:hypothetical protein
MKKIAVGILGLLPKSRKIILVSVGAALVLTACHKNDGLHWHTEGYEVSSMDARNDERLEVDLGAQRNQ